MSKNKTNSRMPKLNYYDWCLIIPLVVTILVIIFGNFGFLEPLKGTSPASIILQGIIYTPIGLFFLGMLYNMVKRGHWIWLTITLIFSYASYEYGNGYWWGAGIFIALIFYFTKLRKEFRKLESKQKR